MHQIDRNADIKNSDRYRKFAFRSCVSSVILIILVKIQKLYPILIEKIKLNSIVKVLSLSLNSKRFHSENETYLSTDLYLLYKSKYIFSHYLHSINFLLHDYMSSLNT